MAGETNTEPPASGVTQPVTSGSGAAKRQRPSRKALVVGLLCLLLLAAVAGGVVFYLRPQGPRVQLKTGQAVGGQIEQLTPAETKSVANAKTDPNKDMNAAYAKALALSQQGEQKQAVQEFQAIADTGKAPYYMLQDYALVQARSGNLKGAVTQLKAAIEAVKNDKSMNPDVQKTELHLLNNKLVGFEEEAGEQ